MTRMNQMQKTQVRSMYPVLKIENGKYSIPTKSGKYNVDTYYNKELAYENYEFKLNEGYYDNLLTIISENNSSEDTIIEG